MKQDSRPSLQHPYRNTVHSCEEIRAFVNIKLVWLRNWEYGIKPGESYTRWVGLLLSISCTGDTINTASQVVCIVPMVMHFTD